MTEQRSDDARSFWAYEEHSVGQILDYDNVGKACDGRPGLWGMLCWNAMSPEHQEELVVTGKFRGYGGGTCSNPAQIGIETLWDRNPAPRFYCLPCSLTYLEEVRSENIPSDPDVHG